MANIQDVLASKKPTRRSVLVPKDDGSYDAYRDLERTLRAAEKAAEMSNDRKKQLRVKELAEQLDKLGKEVDDSKVEFVFESIGRAAYATLIEQHPPTKQDEKDKLPFNGDTFPPALIAACCVEPEGIDLTTATKIWTEWSDAECELLLSAAIAVNRSVRDAPFTRPATGGIESSERSLTTALNGESLTAVS